MAPRSAASAGVSPKRLALKSACSPTMIASSTTIPIHKIKANREIMLRVMPKAYIIAIEKSIAAGIPSATQNAVLALRNKNNKIKTRKKPWTPFFNNIFKRFLIASARVPDNSIITPAGRVRCSASAAVSTRSCISIASP